MKPKKNSATIVNGNLAIQVNLAVNTNDEPPKPKRRKRTKRSKAEAIPGKERQDTYVGNQEAKGIKQFNRWIPDAPQIHNALDVLAQKIKSGDVDGPALEQLVQMAELNTEHLAFIHDVATRLKPGLKAWIVLRALKLLLRNP